MAWTVDVLLQTLDATEVTPQGLAGLLGHSALVLQVRSLDAKIAQKVAERDAAMLAFEEELAALASCEGGMGVRGCTLSAI